MRYRIVLSKGILL